MKKGEDFTKLAEKLARGVDASYMRDERKLRKLIEKISRAVNVPVSKQTSEAIVKTVLNSKLSDLEKKIQK